MLDSLPSALRSSTLCVPSRVPSSSWPPMDTCAMGSFSCSMVLDSVDMVSDTLLALVRGAKMEAKCSSLTVRGIVCVMEMGRCNEKNDDSPRAVNECIGQRSQYRKRKGKGKGKGGGDAVVYRPPCVHILKREKVFFSKTLPLRAYILTFL